MLRFFGEGKLENQYDEIRRDREGSEHGSDTQKEMVFGGLEM